MSKRILQHIIFWVLFILMYVIVKMFFAEESDLAYPIIHRFFRFFMMESVLLIWKILPFYFLFYFLVPRYFHQKEYLMMGLFFLSFLLICVLGYRSVLLPVLNVMYDKPPDFNAFSLRRILYTFTDMIPAIGAASSIKLLKENMAASQKEEALREEKLASELNFLKAQTNPHFLFNTLNNIYGLARRKDNHTAPSIMKLSNIMRFILYECSSRTIPLVLELKIIEDYVELERLRYDDRLKVNFIKSIDKEDQAIAPLILLPFVENAFKHGASENRFDTIIDIYVELSDKQLNFSVKNTCDNEEDDLKEGIGLSNVKRQLDLIYGKNYTINISKGDQTFLVELLIDLDQHE